MVEGFQTNNVWIGDETVEAQPEFVATDVHTVHVMFVSEQFLQ